MTERENYRMDNDNVITNPFKQVTKDLDKPYEETKEEYKKH